LKAGVYCAQTVVFGGGPPAAGAPVRFQRPFALGVSVTSKFRLSTLPAASGTFSSTRRQNGAVVAPEFENVHEAVAETPSTKQSSGPT
jgi:hypothetical protein